jgi:hypothetical protein
MDPMPCHRDSEQFRGARKNKTTKPETKKTRRKNFRA